MTKVWTNEEAGLHDPARHEPLAGAEWSDTAAVAAIERLIEEFVAAREPGCVWPTHPLEDAPPRTLRSAYLGAAGAVQALEMLARAGYEAPRWAAELRSLHAAFLEKPDVRREAGLQLGEVGILAPAVLARPEDQTLRADLLDAMARASAHPAQEITSGGAGALAAALALAEATAQPVWRDAARRLAEALWKGWSRRDDTGTWLWDHEIFGSTRRYFGGCHGVAGNAALLARAADSEEQAGTALRRAVDALEQGALREGDFVNWPVSPDPSGGRRLLQWCHGAPGVIVALADAPGADAETAERLDALLTAAGETIWAAGPLAKGPGICHGNAGNGYAFLKLHRRTGDVRWLDRARCFAMHAMAQSEAQRELHGQRRFTLWPGDGGLAVFLHHCRHPEQTALPGLDVF